MNTVNIETLIYNGDCLGELLEVLDNLHTAASDNKLHTFTTMNKAELVGLLKDLIFTAKETIEEIETKTAAHNKQAHNKREAKTANGRGSGQNAADMNALSASALPANIVQFVSSESLTETRQAQ